MIKISSILALTVFLAIASASGKRSGSSQLQQTNSLCDKTEHIIFSCTLKPTTRVPAKIVSLCASKDLSKESGYLQYRFGLPGKIELEFPKSREATQKNFRYNHYFRFQVDLTEINFQIDEYQYQIFDNFNGEEKPAISEQGVNVTRPGKSKDVTYVCRSKAKADFSALPEVLDHEGNQ